MKGYLTKYGYVGFLPNGSKMLFSTEEDYKEFMEDEDMKENIGGNRIPDKQYLIENHIRFEQKMEELKQTYAVTERAYKKYVLGIAAEEE